MASSLLSTSLSLIAGLLVFSSLPLVVGATPAEPAADDEAHIRQLVTDFAAAGDRRDLTALGALTHEQFRVVFTVRGQAGLTVMDRASYFGMIEAGRAGGVERSLELRSIRIDDDLATVEAVMTSSAARFDTTWTVARGEEGWLLVQDSVVFAPQA